MRIFHELVEEVFLSGPTNLPAKVFWPAVLGNMDNLRFIVIADRVSGSSLLLGVTLTEMFDLNGERGGVLKTLLSVAPVVGQSNVYQASLSEAELLPASYGCGLGYSLSGTSPAAHIRIWVTGRGRA